jgi:hypothetical protein
MQTEHRESGKFAAMKRVPIQDDLELDDFMVEIDILAEYKHRNIVGLHEAYFYDQALWVGLGYDQVLSVGHKVVKQGRFGLLISPSSLF